MGAGAGPPASAVWGAKGLRWLRGPAAARRWCRWRAGDGDPRRVRGHGRCPTRVGVLRSEKHLHPWARPGLRAEPPALGAPGPFAPARRAAAWQDGALGSPTAASAAGAVSSGEGSVPGGLAEVGSAAPAKEAAGAGTEFLSVPGRPPPSLGERACPGPAAELQPQRHRCRLPGGAVGASGKQGSCGHPMGTAAALLGWGWPERLLGQPGLGAKGKVAAPGQPALPVLPMVVCGEQAWQPGLCSSAPSPKKQ